MSTSQSPRSFSRPPVVEVRIGAQSDASLAAQGAREELSASRTRSRPTQLRGPSGEYRLRSVRDAIVTITPTELDADEPPWLGPIASEIGELLRLPRGWDSYGALPIDPQAAAAALRLLFELMQADTSAPSVAPTSDSGLQLDWHSRGVDLEVMISPEGQASIWCLDRQTGNEWDAELDRDPTTLERLRGLLAEVGRRARPS